jgi:hypothetical protein
VQQIERHFAGAHERREALLRRPAAVGGVLRRAADRARAAARETLRRCREACGFGGSPA